MSNEKEKFVNWAGLQHYHKNVTNYIADEKAECLKFGGILTFIELPDPTRDNVNYTYTVTDGFTADTRFLDPQRIIPPKTTVQVVEVGINDYKYSVFKEEEVSLQPVYEDIEELRTQLEDGSSQLDNIQDIIEVQSNSIEEITNAQNATATEVEELTVAVETMTGTISSIEDLSNRTDERVDTLSDTMNAVQSNVNSLTSAVNTKAEKSQLDDISKDVAELSATIDTKVDQSSLDRYATDEELAEVEKKIPSVNGLATETYVQAKIAEAQLNSDGDVDLSVYVTQDELNTCIEQIHESIVYGEF